LNLNGLRYLQSDDIEDDETDSTSNTSTSTTSNSSSTSTNSSTTTSSDKESSTNPPNPGATTNTKTNTDDSTTDNTSEEEKPTSENNSNTNSPVPPPKPTSNKSTNINNTSQTTSSNNSSSNQVPVSKYDYLLKSYDSWEEFFNNISYDNTFKYLTSITQKETQENPLPPPPEDIPNQPTNETKTNSTPPPIGRQTKTKYKIMDGSFLDEILNSSLKLNISRIPKTAKLRMAIVISTPGVHRPEADNIGQFKPYIATQSINIMQQVPEDIFGMQWDIRRNINEKGLKYAEKFAQKSKSLYQRLGLTNFSDINETDFISVESNLTITYTQNVLQYFFTQFKNAIIENSEYTDDKLDNFEFTNKIGNKMIGNLLKDYNDIYFGFGYKKCPKFKAWMNQAESNTFLLKYYQARFNKTLNAFAKYFEDKPNFYSLNSDQPYLKITENQLLTNFTLGSILVNAFYANLVNSMGDEDSMNKLYEIIPKELVESDLFALKSFLTYEYVLYSHMHTYLMVSPFYEQMFKEFNKAIRDSNYTRKYLYYSASEDVLAALFKLFYFKTPDFTITRYDYKIDIADTLKRSLLHQNCPFIDFGYSVSFELYENQERSQKVYYIGFRQNNSDSLTFLMTGENFIEAIKLFYLDPTMTPAERKFWCRS
jgi:hypothetical protein